MATTTISNLPALTPASGTVVYAENSSQSGKIDVDNVSNYALTSYNGATLAGSVQTPKAAIDGLNTKIGSTTMGTTATTITGAIAEHESDISTLNSNLSKVRVQPSIYSDRVTNLQGGYIQIGNLVFVFLFFVSNYAQSSGYNTFFTGMPIPGPARVALAVQGINDNAPHIQASIESNGSIRLYGVVAQNESVSLSGVYYAAT